MGREMSDIGALVGKLGGRIISKINVDNDQIHGT